MMAIRRAPETRAGGADRTETAPHDEAPRRGGALPLGGHSARSVADEPVRAGRRPAPSGGAPPARPRPQDPRPLHRRPLVGAAAGGLGALAGIVLNRWLGPDLGWDAETRIIVQAAVTGLVAALVLWLAGRATS
ncbi:MULTISPECIES: hypothetical protein [unclassified Methylobacterium]|uniref:hypothetical protein n=1 Tax=unclassified Methylobacterium TaxID=2615210 RepID=UPI00031A3ED5|nr:MULTISPECIES: hypothetical protein [Methylobacterium]WFT81538.1 hypothetical protein QA634_06550 [Methylobacterium nodulans]